MAGTTPIPIFHFAKFLTNAPNPWRIRENERVQLSVYVRDVLSVSGKIRMYNSAGAVLTTDTITAVTISARRMSVIVDPSAFSVAVAGVAYFDVWLEVHSLSFEGEAGARRTEIRRYVIDRTPIRSESIRLMWVNRFGGEDAYTFTADQTWQLEVSKERAITEVGIPWLLSDVGYKPVSIFAEENVAIYSQFEKRETLKWLLEILSAPAAWIMQVPLCAYENPNVVETLQRIPIDVTTEGHAWEDQDSLIQIKLSFRYSNPIVTQNG